MLFNLNKLNTIFIIIIDLLCGFYLGSFLCEYSEWIVSCKNFSLYKSNPIEKQYYKAARTHKFKKIGSCHFGPIYQCKECELLANKSVPILMPFAPYTCKREHYSDDIKVITTTCCEEKCKNVLF